MRSQRSFARFANPRPACAPSAVPTAGSRALTILNAGLCALGMLLLVGCSSGKASDDANIAAAQDAADTAPSSATLGPQGLPASTSSLASAADQFLSVGPVRVRYRVFGEGAPVLLLHGYSDRIEMWSGTADSLARTFKVIVPDLRGFGESSTPAGVFEYGRHMMTDLVALMDTVGVEQAHVVGYSLGGLLAAQLALDFPERVSSLTLAAGVFYADSTAAHRELEPHAAAIERGDGLASFIRFILPTWSDSLVTSISEQLEATNDKGALVDVLRSMPSLTVDWDRQPDARTPVIALVGTADPLMSHSLRLKARWQGVELLSLPNRDHIDIVYAPELIQAVQRRANR